MKLAKAEFVALCKGAATFFPRLNRLRKRIHRVGGNTEDPEYCYSLWMRYLVVMQHFDWDPVHQRLCEFGPGNSIGLGLTALLWGANSYLGLDTVPYPLVDSAAEIVKLARKLSSLVGSRAWIPDAQKYPQIRPQLEDYSFPVLRSANSADTIDSRVQTLIQEAQEGFPSRCIEYLAAYERKDLGSYYSTMDALFSQAVMEHVSDLRGSYELMFKLLRPGGLSWHIIDFRSHGLATEWNGHWALPEWAWRIIQGRREFLINRSYYSQHLENAQSAGFEIVQATRYKQKENKELAPQPGLNRDRFVSPFSSMPVEDANTVGSLLILRKPE